MLPLISPLQSLYWVLLYHLSYSLYLIRYSIVLIEFNLFHKLQVPIVLPCTDFTKALIESSGKNAVTLVNKHGENMAILRNPEIYENRKEEIVSRIFGVVSLSLILRFKGVLVLFNHTL